MSMKLLLRSRVISMENSKWDMEKGREEREKFVTRPKCYRCYRPASSCMCAEVRPVKNRTKFVILMHPKEYRKVKNGTGHLTHLSLENSELYVGIDFSKHQAINALIDDEKNRCVILYPSQRSIELNGVETFKEDTQLVVFLIDSTWACAEKMMRLSSNLHALEHMSFRHEKNSQFQIKEQPHEHCLSTIESTQTVLEILSMKGYENLDASALEGFLNPFKKMIAYQLQQLDIHKDAMTSRYRIRH